MLRQCLERTTLSHLFLRSTTSRRRWIRRSPSCSQLLDHQLSQTYLLLLRLCVRLWIRHHKFQSSDPINHLLILLWRQAHSNHGDTQATCSATILRGLTLLLETLTQSHESLTAQSQHRAGRQRTRRENSRNSSTKRDAPNSFTSSCLKHFNFHRETTTSCLHETLLHFGFPNSHHHWLKDRLTHVQQKTTRRTCESEL